jgi:hypothetical protein
MPTPLQPILLLGYSSQEPASALFGGIFGIFFLFWCGGMTLAVAHFVLFLTVIIRVLTSRQMPTENRIIWAVVAWFLPLIGSILFWTIGVKDNRPIFSGNNQPPPAA